MRPPQREAALCWSNEKQVTNLCTVRSFDHFFSCANSLLYNYTTYNCHRFQGQSSHLQPAGWSRRLSH